MEDSPFYKLGQIGVVVKDMEMAIDHYKSLGIGPFEPLEKLTYIKREMWGKPIIPESVKLKVTIADMGAAQLEVIQPVEGDSLWQRFLDTKGEGIIHLCFFVYDIEEEEVKLGRERLTILYRSRFKGGGGATYFDTGRIGGVLLELCEWPVQSKYYMGKK